LDGRLVQLHEHAIVDLTETQQLENLARSRMDLVDTANSNHERQLRLIGNVVVASLARLTLQLNSVALLLTILVDVLLGALEDLDLLDFGSLKIG
jgi:hypothetical protein